MDRDNVDLRQPILREPHNSSGVPERAMHLGRQRSDLPSRDLYRSDHHGRVLIPSVVHVALRYEAVLRPPV